MEKLPPLIPSARTVRKWLRAGWREIRILTAVMLLTGGLWTFAELADEVMEGETHRFDRFVLLALRNQADLSDPLGPAWFEAMARDITSLGGVVILLMVSAAAVGFLFLVRRPAAALLVVVSVGGGTLLSTLLKMGFERARPDLVPHATEVFTASFPSGHAMLSAVVYLTLGVLLARTQSRRRVKAYLLTIALLLTGMVGASRVYLGVHWPTDVVAGWCIGSAWAILCWLVARWLQYRGRMEPEAFLQERNGVGQGR
ncbi:phosphatase PAP2 family protein [Thiohalorhabdus sp. Cl-TMA]|uniref:undecaprenyl-diphosphate phosphatase n=1 Tax=Thiohalorhabdus methylotrophus TaxID=3242694 RepID=A0ABV4TTM3_9GAMM